MKRISYSLIFFILILCGACSSDDVQSQKVKTLDSLGGCLNAIVNEINRADTVVLQKYIARLDYYRQFISENIGDTITKDQADNLKHFYAGGANIEAFNENRKLIVSRAGLISSQLLKLSGDLRNNIDPAFLAKFISDERNETSTLIEIGYKQQEIFHASLEEFKNSLYGVEDLIRSRNNGELPIIIKDTIVL